MEQLQITDLYATAVSNNFEHITAVCASTLCIFQKYILG